MIAEKYRDFFDALVHLQREEFKTMKARIRNIVFSLFMLGLTLTYFTPIASAQDSAPDSAEAPLNIVVQSIEAEAGSIEWVMLLLAPACLVLITLTLNGVIQRQLRTTVRAEGRRMSLEEHVRRQSDDAV